MALHNLVAQQAVPNNTLQHVVAQRLACCLLAAVRAVAPLWTLSPRYSRRPYWTDPPVVS